MDQPTVHLNIRIPYDLWRKLHPLSRSRQLNRFVTDAIREKFAAQQQPTKER